MSEFSGIPWGEIFLNFIWIFGLAIILGVLSYFEFLVHLKKTKRKDIFKRNPIRKAIYFGVFLILFGICATFILNLLSEEPEVLLIENKIQIPPSSLLGNKIVKRDHIVMSENGHLRSKKIQFEESKYLIRVMAYGQDVLGETPNIKIYIGLYLIADYFTSDSYIERIFEFQSKKREKRRLRIEFVNDYYDLSNNLNRNALIQSIEIIKLNE